jgi:hypothetical protein
MKTEKLADKVIVWMFCGSLVVIAANVSWLRELFVIWLAVSVPFLLFPLFGCSVYPKLQSWGRRATVALDRPAGVTAFPARVHIPYTGPFPQRSFHHKDFTIN